MHRLLMGFCLVALSWASAQKEMTADTTYPAGTSLKNSYFGVTLSVPRGMQAQFVDQQGVQLLALGNDSVALLVLFQFGVAAETYQQAFSQEFSLDTLQLSPQARPSRQNNQVRVLVADASGTQGVLTALLGNTRSSLVVIGLSNAGAQTAGNAVNALLAGVRFTSPMAGSGDANLKNQWVQRLSDKLLQRSNSNFDNSVTGSSGSSSDTRVTMCRNKTFSYFSESGVMVSIPGGEGASSVSRTEFAGRWEVEYANSSGAVLSLTDSSGLQLRWAVRLLSGQLTIDGVRWAVQNTRCS